MATLLDLFFTACSIFLVYLYDVMHAFEKIRELVILDWYFSGRIEITSTWKKCNKRKECRYVILFYLLTFLHLITNCWSVNIIYCSIAAQAIIWGICITLVSESVLLLKIYFWCSLNWMKILVFNWICRSYWNRYFLKISSRSCHQTSILG